MVSPKTSTACSSCLGLCNLVVALAALSLVSSGAGGRSPQAAGLYRRGLQVHGREDGAGEELSVAPLTVTIKKIITLANQRLSWKDKPRWFCGFLFGTVFLMS